MNAIVRKTIKSAKNRDAIAFPATVAIGTVINQTVRMREHTKRNTYCVGEICRENNTKNRQRG